MEQLVGQRCQSDGCNATEDLDFCEDPFLAEVHDDHTRFWLCVKCWEASADDI